MIAEVCVRLGFEAAHRLPALGGKCANLHGHSWSAEFTLTGVLDPDSSVIAGVDLGEIKLRLRGWIDAHLDHATLLGADDPLIKALAAEGCRCFVFGYGPGDGIVPGDAEALACDLRWPSTEAVAALLHRVAAASVADWPRIHAGGVRVAEAPTIAARCWP